MKTWIWILIGIVIASAIVGVLLSSSGDNSSTNEFPKDTAVDIEDWAEVNAEALEDLEKVMNCAQKSGVNIGDLIGEYMENAGECIMLYMDDDVAFERCLDKHIAPLEREFNKLAYNPQFRLCVEMS